MSFPKELEKSAQDISFSIRVMPLKMEYESKIRELNGMLDILKMEYESVKGDRDRYKIGYEFYKKVSEQETV